MKLSFRSWAVGAAIAAGAGLNNFAGTHSVLLSIGAALSAVAAYLINPGASAPAAPSSAPSETHVNP